MTQIPPVKAMIKKMGQTCMIGQCIEAEITITQPGSNHTARM